MTRDSKEYWKCQLQNEIGTKHDLEYMSAEGRPDVKYTTLAAVFRTMAFPYTSAYYFQRLFSTTEEELANLTIRRCKVLVNSTAIEWVGSFIAELDLKYFSIDTNILFMLVVMKRVKWESSLTFITVL